MHRDENVRRIRSGVVRLSRRLRAERPADALAPTKISVLAQLWRNGRMSAGDLADLERIQPQSLTRTLAALEADGLILRRPDELDRRRAEWKPLPPRFDYGVLGKYQKIV